MIDITYVGPSDEEEFQQGAVWRQCKHGQTISVLDAVAESLLEQTDKWQRAKKSPTTKKDSAS